MILRSLGDFRISGPSGPFDFKSILLNTRFERVSTKELLGYLGDSTRLRFVSRLRSMLALVQQCRNRRPLGLADSDCSPFGRWRNHAPGRSTAWITSIEKSPAKGKRHLAQYNIADNRPREHTEEFDKTGGCAASPKTAPSRSSWLLAIGYRLFIPQHHRPVPMNRAI